MVVVSRLSLLCKKRSQSSNRGSACLRLKMKETGRTFVNDSEQATGDFLRNRKFSDVTLHIDAATAHAEGQFFFLCHYGNGCGVSKHPDLKPPSTYTHTRTHLTIYIITGTHLHVNGFPRNISCHY